MSAASRAAAEWFAGHLGRRPRLTPLYWIGLAVLTVGIDYLLGPFVQFPIVFVVPVALAAWFSGRGWGLVLAVLLPLARLGFTLTWEVPWGVGYSLLNLLIRVAVLATLAVLVDRTARQGRELAKRVGELEGLLPICSACKKIRDEHDVWHPVESYVAARSAASFTHGYCPACAKQWFGEFAAEE